MPMHVNITTKVSNKSIRREMVNGREHWVVPSYTLPSNVVMNDILYPRAEVERTYMSLNDTLAPLGHPMVNGEFVSAFSPEGINVGHIGAWNRNVKLQGNRVYLEKFIDIEVAQRTDGGKRLIERLEAIERGDDVPAIHTSVAAFIDTVEAPKDAGYKSVASIVSFDHDAILLDEPGAATPEQGVGLMVNADNAIPLAANSGALIGESYREREQRLDRAAKEQFATGNDDYVYVVDFTDSQAIVVARNNEPTMYGYTNEAGKITFDVSTATPVARQESWVTMAVNKLKCFFNPQARPAINKEGDMPISKEERAELTQEISQAVIKDVGTVVANALQPFTEQLNTLKTNQDAIAQAVTANARAEEADKRKAVAEKHGEIVANALQGEALEVMYQSLGSAAALGNGNLNTNQKTTGAPKIDDYFTQEAK